MKEKSTTSYEQSREELLDEIERLKQRVKQLESNNLPATSDSHSPLLSLLQQNNGFDYFVNHIQSGITLHKLIFDKNGKMIDTELLQINRRFEEILGMKGEDVIGKRMNTVFPGFLTLSEEAAEAIERAGADGQKTQFSTYSELTNKWYDFVIYGPAPGYALVIFYDISHKEELKKNLYIYRRVFRDAKEAMAICDDEGRILNANRAFRKQFMLQSSTEFVNIWDLHSNDARDFIHMELLPNIKRQSHWQGELEGIDSDGNSITLWESINVLLNQNNEIDYFVFRIYDITEQRKMEKKVQQLLDEKNVILENAIVGIAYIQYEKFVWMNDRLLRIFNYEQGELADASMNILLPAHKTQEEYQDEIQKMQSIFYYSDSYYDEYITQRKNGELFWCSVSVKLIDQNNPEAGSIWVVQDIDERKRNENNLKKAERALQRAYESVEIKVKKRTEELGRTVALLLREIEERNRAEKSVRNSLQEKELLLKEIHHRVKNNLNVISAFLDLQENYLEDDQIKQIFKDSKSRVAVMSIIHEKLYQSRDFVNINKEDYFSQLIYYLLETYHISEEALTFSLSIDKNINLDLDSFITVGLIVNEALSNTLKYAFPDNGPGHIDITMKKIDEERFMLLIKDNGIGFPEHLDLNNMNSLGLSIMASMVKQGDGEITLSNDNGAQIKILLYEKE